MKTVKTVISSLSVLVGLASTLAACAVDDPPSTVERCNTGDPGCDDNGHPAPPEPIEVQTRKQALDWGAAPLSIAFGCGHNDTGGFSCSGSLTIGLVSYHFLCNFDDDGGSRQCYAFITGTMVP